MSGKFHQPQLWVKKTAVNNNQPQTPSSSNTTTNNTPSNNNNTPNVATSNDQSSSTQPNNPSSSPSTSNTPSSSTPKITSTLKHNATPFTPQNFVPLSQPVPQPVPTTSQPPATSEKQPHPKKNHPKKQHQKANQANNNQQNNQGNVGNNTNPNSNNNNNNNNEQHYGSLLKNKTKVIIRNIPYNFTEQDFIVKCVPKSFVTEQVKQQPPVVPAATTTTSEPSTPTLPEIPHFIYDPKKITWSDFHSGHKTMTQVFSTIVYLNFASVALLHQFKNEFYEELKSKQSVSLSSSVQITDDDVDESPIPTLTSNTSTSIWRETPMTIEYCPLQMVPKPKKKDPRDGTIFKDEHYLKFLEQLKQPKDLTLQPLSLDNSSTTSGLALDGGESSDGSSTSSKKLGTNIPLALGGVGASSSYTKKTDEPIISPLLKELLEKKNKKGGGNQNDPNKPKGNNPKKSGKPQYKRKY